MSKRERRAAHRLSARYDESRWECHYCRAYFGKKRRSKLTMDHVIPTSRGGPNLSWNRVLCCVPCNTRKGNRTYEAFTGKPELPTQCHEWYRTTSDFLNAQARVAQ